MSVPNHFSDVKKLFDTGLFNLKTHEGQAAFTDACVSMLHGKDEDWGHLIKKPAQTDIHDHGEDSALYKLADGKAQAVDFIGGAGGPNPQPAWQVDTVTPYTHEDWFDPTDHGILDPPPPVCPPVPPSFPYPSETDYGLVFQAMVKRAYNDAGRQFPDPNDSDAFRHFIRFGYSSRSMPPQDAVEKHIKELRQALGVSHLSPL